MLLTSDAHIDLHAMASRKQATSVCVWYAAMNKRLSFMPARTGRVFVNDKLEKIFHIFQMG